MSYQELHPGDKLEKSDEYSTMPNAWRSIPDFMIGDVIPDCDSTQWRRPDVELVKKKVPKWFQRK